MLKIHFCLVKKLGVKFLDFWPLSQAPPPPPQKAVPSYGTPEGTKSENSWGNLPKGGFYKGLNVQFHALGYRRGENLQRV